MKILIVIGTLTASAMTLPLLVHQPESPTLDAVAPAVFEDKSWVVVETTDTSGQVRSAGADLDRTMMIHFASGSRMVTLTTVRMGTPVGTEVGTYKEITPGTIEAHDLNGIWMMTLSYTYDATTDQISFTFTVDVPQTIHMPGSEVAVVDVSSGQIITGDSNPPTDFHPEYIWTCEELRRP